MNRLSAAALTIAALLVWSRGVAAQENALTLDQTLRLARQRAPAVLSARGRIDEARGRLVGASILLRANPLIEGGAGYRWAGADSTSEARASVSQAFELGGKRGARIDAAEAGISRAVSTAEDATRRLLRDVALGFMRAIYADETLRLATATDTVAADVLRISERRHQAGDIPRLDVNLARVALARARAEIRAADGAKNAALGELRVLLGMSVDEPLAVRGDLRDRRRFDLQELIARGSDSPFLKALVAEVREAQSDQRLGAAQRWPDLGIGANYERHERANIAVGIVSLTLPIFDNGQGVRAEATARERRVSGELAAGKRVLAVEIRTAFDVFARRVEAVEELEQNALPLLDENEAQIRRAYEGGQIGLPDFLAVRREILGTRVEYLDRLFEAATAGIELAASAGVLR